MELPHKPEWASHLMETVKIYDLTRYCPLMEKDKKKIRKQTREPMEKYEAEDVHFWIGPPSSCPIFTTFAAYLKKYICQPDCCKNNESVIAMNIADAENLKIKEKLHNGEQMLEEILKMDESFFPNDEDRSFFGKLQFFYNTIANCCVSCGDAFDGEECLLCATRRIQMEELFHAERIWYNTGQHNVYMMVAPFYCRVMKKTFCVGLITQRLDKKEWYSAERAAVRCFLGCSERNKDRMPHLFVLCVNTVIKHCDEGRITYLPLPRKIKEQILSEIISPERQLTDHVVGEHYTWIFPTDETLCLRPRGCYFYTKGEPRENAISC